MGAAGADEPILRVPFQDRRRSARHLPHGMPQHGHLRVTVEIVILAMIAAFLGLRLYAVLGRRAEHGEEPMHPRFDRAPTPGAARPAVVAARMPVERAGTAAVPAAGERPPLVERGLREIATADRRFDAASFIEGARAAYRMILEAFWRGDRDELAQLCDRAVWQSFADEIAARAAAGEVVDNRLVRINEATIITAGVGPGATGTPTARIAMRFVADIAAVTRDAEGHLIAGSLDDAIEVRDVWTFVREIGAASPDWVLDETDEG